MEEVIISDHALGNRKRLGLSKSAFKRIAKQAFIKGIKHNETKGRLNRYLTKTYFKEESADNIRIFHEFIWIFSKNILITEYPIPRHLKKYL